jgi:hypothetical protein
MAIEPSINQAVNQEKPSSLAFKQRSNAAEIQKINEPWSLL